MIAYWDYIFKYQLSKICFFFACFLTLLPKEFENFYSFIWGKGGREERECVCVLVHKPGGSSSLLVGKCIYLLSYLAGPKLFSEVIADSIV